MPAMLCFQMILGLANKSGVGQKFQRAMVVGALKLEADQINKQGPMPVGEVTLTGAKYEKPARLTYFYKVDADTLMVTSEAAKSNVTKQVCNLAASRGLLDAGAALAFNYVNTGGILLLEFEVNVEDCNSK